MSDPFIGEIKVFSCNFAPLGWAECDGRILPIQQYTALFAVIGNAFGGDGRTNFALPNLQGRVPLHAGQGQGLTNRAFAASGGSTAVALTQAQMAGHTHKQMGSAEPGAGNAPEGAVFGVDQENVINCYRAPTPGSDSTMRANALSTAGGGGAHNNMQPYQALRYCIALQGLFPPRQ